jgi:hypothetical protein
MCIIFVLFLYYIIHILSIIFYICNILTFTYYLIFSYHIGNNIIKIEINCMYK